MSDTIQPVAVTKYTTEQVSDDKWTYRASETRIFQGHETIADIVNWASGGGNAHWRDLVFTPIHRPAPRIKINPNEAQTMSKDSSEGAETVCPNCGGLLERVRQSSGSYLNADQFDAIRAGDWFCRCCSGSRGHSGYRYYWNHEVKPDQPQ